MKIINKAYDWSQPLAKRNETRYIILHHRAGEGDADSIHHTHLSNGWAGIGYHFYVRKSGEVFKGRPIATVGAHTTGKNSISLGICFEGNFENEIQMPKSQIKSGGELIAYLKTLYPKAEIRRHRDFGKTACPGQNFPFDAICKGVKEVTLEEAIEILQAKSGIEDETVDFLLCYKYGEELVKKLAEAMV